MLILRDVLRWQATEVAELLDTTAASVNSALRARATLATLDVDATEAPSVSADQHAVVGRSVDAFERYDVPALVALLHDDVVMSMPPYDFWLHGPAEMGRWFVGGGRGCRGSRLVATTANGGPAFGSYRPDGRSGYRPFALQVIELSGDRIVGHHNFVDPALIALFGLPAHRSSDHAGHDVSQADELEQSHQLPRGVPHPDRVAHSPGDELQSGQAVDRVEVGTGRRQGPAHHLDVTQHQGHDRVRVSALHTATTTASGESERRRR